MLLQAYIISRLNSEQSENVDISLESLYFSVLFALLHTFMEGCILYLDSRACMIGLEQYAIICLNARLSWVPFSNLLLFGNKKESLKIDYFLSYENIVSKLLCLEYQLDFEFSTESWKIFTKYVTSMPAFAPDPFLYDKFSDIGYSVDVDTPIGMRFFVFLLFLCLCLCKDIPQKCTCVVFDVFVIFRCW